MSASHDRALPSTGNERRLWLALALTSSFMVAEVIAGVLTNSLALISDAAHMLTDAAASAIALAAVQVGKKAADAARTFGYYRFEILAAAFNCLMLFGVAIYILVEAYGRFKNPPDVQSGAMMAVAFLGLVINLISMKLLQSGKEASLNIKGHTLKSGATCWVRWASSLARSSSALPDGPRLTPWWIAVSRVSRLRTVELIAL